MAHFEPSRTAPFGAISIHRAVTAFEAALSAYRRWSVARKTDAALHKLTDRELEDIGLERGWISDVSGDFARR